jgi:hypothetical protein
MGGQVPGIAAGLAVTACLRTSRKRCVQ